MASMATSAIIRVKRSLDEQPLEALLVSSKRRKFNEHNEEVPFNATVLTFAGTVKSQEDDSVHSQLSSTLNAKEQAKGTFKAHVPAVTEKLRKQLKSKWQEGRFKVVNLSRFQGKVGENDSSEVIPEEITVVDIELQSTEIQDSAGKSSESLGNYEYDLYYAESAADLCSGVLESVLSVQPYELASEIVDCEDDEPGEDSDNEDDENNWRNDYPDEQSDEDRSEKGEAAGGGDDDDDLMDRMAKFGIGSGEELSDDDDDEALIYGREESPFEDYRRRKLRQLREGSDSSSDSEAGNLNDSFESL